MAFGWTNVNVCTEMVWFSFDLSSEEPNYISLNKSDCSEIVICVVTLSKEAKFLISLNDLKETQILITETGEYRISTAGLLPGTIKRLEIISIGDNAASISGYYTLQ